LPGRRAGRQVEAETQIRQEFELEPHEQGRCEVRIREMVDEMGQGFVKGLERLPLRQGLEAMGKGGDSVQGEWRIHEKGGSHPGRFDLKQTQLLLEARPPGEGHAVAALEDGPEPSRAPAVHEAEMPAMVAGHHFEDDARLAVLAGSQNDALISPVHEERSIADELRPST
jgi:hypothetical protein